MFKGFVKILNTLYFEKQVVEKSAHIGLCERFYR